jgi:hypothetical protein
MNALARALRGLLGLFVDDGKLALTLIALLLAVGLLTHAGAVDGSLALLLLVGGTVIALLANVIRTAALTKR